MIHLPLPPVDLAQACRDAQAPATVLSILSGLRNAVRVRETFRKVYGRDRGAFEWRGEQQREAAAAANQCRAALFCCPYDKRPVLLYLLEAAVQAGFADASKVRGIVR
jgi:hypothetical protein